MHEAKLTKPAEAYYDCLVYSGLQKYLLQDWLVFGGRGNQRCLWSEQGAFKVHYHGIELITNWLGLMCTGIGVVIGHGSEVNHHNSLLLRCEGHLVVVWCSAVVSALIRMQSMPGLAAQHPHALLWSL